METTSTIEVSIGREIKLVPAVMVGNLSYVNMLHTPVRLHVNYGEDSVLIPTSGEKPHLQSYRSMDLYGVEVEISTISEDTLPNMLRGVIYITTKDIAICAADDFKRTDFAWPVPPRGKTDLGSSSQGIFEAARLRMKRIQKH